MTTDQRVCEKIAQIFQKNRHIIAVYFYGSRVSGNAKLKSDLDVAVVADGIKDVNYEDLYRRISQVLQKHEIDLRVITKESSPLFVFQVLKNGHCVYRKNDKERLNFEVGATLEFYDTQHIRDIYTHYLKKSLKEGSYGTG